MVLKEYLARVFYSRPYEKLDPNTQDLVDQAVKHINDSYVPQKTHHKKVNGAYHKGISEGRQGKEFEADAIADARDDEIFGNDEEGQHGKQSTDETK